MDYHCTVFSIYQLGFWKPSQYNEDTGQNSPVFQGAISIRKTVLPGMAIPMLKIRRPNGRLIFNMEIAICR